MEAEASEGYVILTLKYEREGNKWIGTCHELSTRTFARTLRRKNTQAMPAGIDRVGDRAPGRA